MRCIRNKWIAALLAWALSALIVSVCVLIYQLNEIESVRQAIENEVYLIVFLSLPLGAIVLLTVALVPTSKIRTFSSYVFISSILVLLGLAYLIIPDLLRIGWNERMFSIALPSYIIFIVSYIVFIVVLYFLMKEYDCID
jgi:hypothetical protein